MKKENFKKENFAVNYCVECGRALKSEGRVYDDGTMMMLEYSCTCKERTDESRNSGGKNNG